MLDSARGLPDPISPDLARITRAAIHPAIGIARVGNSATEFFFGPDVVNPLSEAPGFYRDAQGALKRQAARFRVYGYDAQGNVVAELTAANAQVKWTARLANLKAAWYAFSQALDIPESVSGGVTSARRNLAVIGANRLGLAIDGGSVTIAGPNVSGPGSAFTGSFLGTPVYLGELRTDAQGCLIVLGGLGHSASADNSPPLTFANNDGWHDDTADGPVRATLVLQGRPIPVNPAWVVVGPPNYGPNLKSVRTMYDMLADMFIRSGQLPNPRVSFTHDIAPIFERMSALQWTNHGFAAAFGHGAPMNFGSAEFLAWASGPLRIPFNPDAEQRIQIANAFRNYDRDGYSLTPLPWLYGDAISGTPPKSDNLNCALSPTQQAALQAWARDDFIGDYNPDVEPPRSIDAVPLSGQPAMLDRAALDFCIADAFHPGCEMTWPMRHAGMYMAPFRLRHADPNTPQPDYGDVLTPGNIDAPNGPLQAQWPGGLTRWMAVPWQTDTGSCLSGYSLSGYMKDYDPYLPTFWPARVPNHVLDEPEYRIVVDESVPREQRKVAFKLRRSWPGVLPGKDSEHQAAAMVTLFPFMGIAEQRPGVAGDPDFPAVMQVTTLPDFTTHPTDPAARSPLSATRADAPQAGRPRAPQGPGYAPSADGSFMGRFPGASRRKED